jgi:hypothetical protein
MSEKHTIEDKKRLAEKIQKIKVGENLEKIKKIIFKENPGLSVKKNSSGIIFYFHNLTESTYSKLDKFLKHLDNKRMLELTKSVSENNDTLMSDMGDVDDNTRNRYRLSNRERNIIKRKQYEKEIGQTDDTDLYVSENESHEQPLQRVAPQSSNLESKEKNASIFVKKETADTPPKSSIKKTKKRD